MQCFPYWEDETSTPNRPKICLFAPSPPNFYSFPAIGHFNAMKMLKRHF